MMQCCRWTDRWYNGCSGGTELYMPKSGSCCDPNAALSFHNLISSPQIDTWALNYAQEGLSCLMTGAMFYLKWEQKAPWPWQGLLRGGNQTLVFCAGDETEALMQSVGQMVGAGAAHWPLCLCRKLLHSGHRPDSRSFTRHSPTRDVRRACRCNACGYSHADKGRRRADRDTNTCTGTPESHFEYLLIRSLFKGDLE